MKTRQDALPSLAQPGVARPRPDWLPHVLLVALIAALVASLAGVAMWQEKQRYRERAAVATQNVSRLLDEHIGDVFDKIDVVLQSVALHHRDMAAQGGIDPGRLNAELRQQVLLLPEVSSLRIIDRDGLVRFGTGLPAGAPVSLADRRYFIQARDEPERGLIIEGPLEARISKEWAIILARRLSAPDGSFAGVVYANLGTRQFENMLSLVELGRHGAATVRTADLALVHRFPDTRGAVGNRDVSPQLRDAVLARPAGGHYLAATALDGVERSNAYRKVGAYPFYVIVGLATDDYLGGWRSSLLLVSSLAGLTVAIAALGAWLLLRAGRRLRADLEERRRIGADLERLLAERTRLNAELVVRADEAEAANRAKSAFLGNMSHELRTPLNHVVGFATLLRRIVADERARLWLDEIDGASHRLLGLINDILEMSRIEANRLHIERVDFELPPLLDRVEQAVGESARAKGIELLRETAPEVPGRLRGDPAHLAQVLGSLMDNAVKFSDGGRITLRVAPDGERDGRPVLRFEIEDQGIGIQPELQPGLFELFNQGDNSPTRRYGGTGLGLALSQRLVMLMGGEIGFGSSPGRGSNFWFSLPLLPEGGSGQCDGAGI